MARLACLVAGLLMLLSMSVTPSHAGDYAKPGPFAVGRQEFTITETSGNHPISAVLWYPADGPAPDPTATTPVDLMNAPAATTGPFPLIVVIHGLGGTGDMFGAVGRHLASHGFVVAAADFDTGPLDGGDDTKDQQAVGLLYARPTAVLRVIHYADELNAPGGKLAGVISLSHIGVWGMSTGGTTAFQAAGAQLDLKALDAWCAEHGKDAYTHETCQFVSHEKALARHYGIADPFAAPLPPIWDSRVAALVAAAPGGELHAFGDKGTAAVKLPTLVMFANDDAVVSPELNALWAYRTIGSSDKAMARFDNGGHTLFMNLWSPNFHEAAGLAAAFFLAVLKGNAAGRAALMQDAVSYPGLSYETTLH